jgi:hypothetical protein
LRYRFYPIAARFFDGDQYPGALIETINKLVGGSRQPLLVQDREPTPEGITEKLAMPVEKVWKYWTSPSGRSPRRRAKARHQCSPSECSVYFFLGVGRALCFEKRHADELVEFGNVMEPDKPPQLADALTNAGHSPPLLSRKAAPAFWPCHGDRGPP